MGGLYPDPLGPTMEEPHGPGAPEEIARELAVGLSRYLAQQGRGAVAQWRLAADGRAAVEVRPIAGDAPSVGPSESPFVWYVDAEAPERQLARLIERVERTPVPDDRAV